MEDIEIRIKAIVENEDAPKTLATQLKELKRLANEVGEENVEAYTKIATEIANVEDKVDDLKDTIKTVKGEPIERLGNSFRGLKDSILKMDFKMVKTNFAGIVDSTKGLLTNLGGMIPMLGGVSNGFKLLAGSIAATGIGALVIAVISLITHFDELRESGGFIGDMFTIIGDAISYGIQKLKDFSDYLGLTNFKEKENAKNREESIKNLDEYSKNYKKSLEDEYNQMKVNGATEEELFNKKKKNNDEYLKWLNKDLETIENSYNKYKTYSDEEIKTRNSVKAAIQEEIINTKLQNKELIDSNNLKNNKIKEDDDKARKDREKRIEGERKRLEDELAKLKINEIKDINARAIAFAKYERDKALETAESTEQRLLIEKIYQEKLKQISQEGVENEKKDTDIKLAYNQEARDKEILELQNKINKQKELEAEAETERKNQLAQGLENTRKLFSEMSNITNGFLDNTNQAASNLVNIIGDSFTGLFTMLQDGSATTTEIVQASLSAVSSTIGAISQMQQASTDQQIENIQKQSDIDIAAQDQKLKNGTITEAQYEANVKKIKDDARKKELAAKKKAFEQEKAMKIVQAVISTAQAVISAFASGGNPIVGAIFAAIAGAVGAAQIALISSQKFPEGGGGGGGTSPSLGPVSTGGGGGGNTSLSGLGSSSTSQSTPNAPSFFGLGQNNLAAGSEQKVYVVESDITNTQDRVAKVRQRSVLGG